MITQKSHISQKISNYVILDKHLKHEFNEKLYLCGK